MYRRVHHKWLFLGLVARHAHEMLNEFIGVLGRQRRACCEQCASGSARAERRATRVKVSVLGTTLEVLVGRRSMSIIQKNEISVVE